MLLLAINNTTGVERHETLRMVDDNVLIKEEEKSWLWVQAFQDIAGPCGIKLAPFKDDKAFLPSTQGAVLGVIYDLPSWTCWIEEKKSLAIIHLLYRVIDCGASMENADIASLNGKLQHYAAIIGEDGKWERKFLLDAQDSSPSPAKWVPVSSSARSQARFWVDRLATIKTFRTTIPDPRPLFPCSGTLLLYTDAAGYDSPGGGWGAVMESESHLIIGQGTWSKGCLPFAGNMVTLEALAGLLGLVSISDVARGRSVELRIDNICVSYAYNKGHSSCPLGYTVLLAIYRLARSLDINLTITWVRRCSDPLSTAADHLSKDSFFAATYNLSPKPPRWGRRSRVLKQWMSHPRETRVLGQAIAWELSHHMGTVAWTLENSDDMAQLCDI